MELSPEPPTISLEILQKHNTRSDCWIAIHSKVWDITSFIDEHPGGSSILLSYAGAIATELYDKFHAPEIITEELSSDKLMGYLEQSAEPIAAVDASQETVNAMESAFGETPLLESIISAQDFEKEARQRLASKTWAFYSSAATDLVTYRQNKELVRRIMLRPRILRNVSNVCTKRSILGYDSTVPFFVSPAAMARLAHPEGEKAIARAASNRGVIQCISANASFPLRSIISAAPESHPFFFQLYVNSDRSKTVEILKTARELGVKAILVTVDAPVPGKREADERAAQDVIVRSAISGGESSKDKKGSGFGRLMAQYIDKSLNWDDIAWLREVCGDMAIVLKGVQTAEDVMMAAEYGVEGVMLSNHGGRSLDGSQASILVLLELRKHCPEVFDKMEIFIDGGFERGSDILKAIALGARAVGIGRPFLYSLIYGQEGAEHLIEILQDELQTSMMLAGITSLEQAGPRLVNTQDIDHLVDNGERPVTRNDRRILSKL
ncbi:cytochrome b2 [Stachybotrys elegans]|uniref:L-lactate dehydrogenase (cytochrome) n=1 Tax=Stachybotrys elegans TaxID=80388 RepID=A0A8K0SQ77_9HYPO|nr:cytochrome b2 [Stachybotrys elegans]